MSILSKKNTLRSLIKEKRAALNTSFKKKHDNYICSLLQQLIVERNCKVVHAYIPMKDEIDITPLLHYLLQEKITVITPKTLRNRKLEHLVLNSLDEVESGIYGTLHPANSIEYSGRYDLIIVPGLAFDTQHYRLGYGGGYYDTFLKNHPAAFTVGVGYPFQKVAQVPKEKHDVFLDTILV